MGSVRDPGSEMLPEAQPRGPSPVATWPPSPAYADRPFFPLSGRADLLHQVWPGSCPCWREVTTATWQPLILGHQLDREIQVQQKSGSVPQP